MKQRRYIYICVCVCVCVCVCIYACVLTKLFKLCLTLCDPMACSLPGSSVHGILQARILKWVPITSSRGCWEADLPIYLYIHTHTYLCRYMCVKTWRDNITWMYLWRMRFEKRGEDVRIELLGNKVGETRREILIGCLVQSS